MLPTSSDQSISSSGTGSPTSPVARIVKRVTRARSAAGPAGADNAAGRGVAAFHQARRKKNKQKCMPGEMYCVKCRAPKMPDGEAEYQQKTATLGNLVGICPDCYTIMNRRVSLAKLGQVCGQMDITMPQALRHITQIQCG
jgi:hypothetical protein